MKVSARNQLKGKITEVTKGATTSHVLIEIGSGDIITASITNEKGQAIFEQRSLEIPKSWSQTATNIVASKYFHGKLGTPERESSVRQLVSRVRAAAPPASRHQPPA